MQNRFHVAIVYACIDLADAMDVPQRDDVKVATQSVINCMNSLSIRKCAVRIMNFNEVSVSERLNVALKESAIVWTIF